MDHADSLAKRAANPEVLNDYNYNYDYKCEQLEKSVCWVRKEKNDANFSINQL